MAYKIFTDAACDLTQQMADELNLTVLPMEFSIDGKQYKNYLDNRELDADVFYNMQRNNEAKEWKTSAVNTGTFTEYFEASLKEGDDILYIAFSSGLSGTYNASLIAIEDLKEKYPERKIFAVDTLCASLGQGLMVYLAAQKKNEGASIEEVAKYIEDTKLHICHSFTVENLKQLHKGGRVSTTVAVVGGILNIKPMMKVDNNGKLISVGKVKGRAASITALCDSMEGKADDYATQHLFISHGGCIEEARNLAKMVSEKYGTPIENIHINYIGPLIGCHSGAGTLALFFVGNER